MNSYSTLGMGASASGWIQAFGPWLPLVLLWSMLWKGLALWHSGRRGQAWWFVVILVLNTLGIIEIIYLFGIAKLKASELVSRKTGTAR